MTQLLHNEIPLCQFMQLEIDTLNRLQINASAPLSPNRNIHQTGFAGSLYALAVATGWAYIQHLLQLADNIDHSQCSLVLKKASIQYRLPVNGDIYLQSGFYNTEKVTLFHHQLSSKNKIGVSLKVSILSNDKTCVRVMGDYVVLQN